MRGPAAAQQIAAAHPHQRTLLSSKPSVNGGLLRHGSYHSNELSHHPCPDKTGKFGFYQRRSVIIPWLLHRPLCRGRSGHLAQGRLQPPGGHTRGCSRVVPPLPPGSPLVPPDRFRRNKPTGALERSAEKSEPIQQLPGHRVAFTDFGLLQKVTAGVRGNTSN